MKQCQFLSHSKPKSLCGTNDWRTIKLVGYLRVVVVVDVLQAS